MYKVLRGHSAAVTSVAFSENDRYLYTGSMDGTFRKWKLPEEKDYKSWNSSNDINYLMEEDIIEKPLLPPQLVKKDSFESL